MNENTPEYAEQYQLKYKSYLEFEWTPYHPNNIPENPHEGYDCVITPRIGHCRRYAIRFQYKADVNGLSDYDAEPDLYILFEGNTFIYACPTLDFAKQRAYTQYAHINRYVASHFDLESQV